MIIKPKTRGFICTTTHPTGCEANVAEQIARVKVDGEVKNGPKNVLVIGSSTGYGLASRITSAFGSGAATLGVFLEKPAKEKKSGSAGWYNSAAFEKAAHAEGLYAKSINGDAFSNEMRDKAIETIKQDMGKIDLVVYSLASPVRKMPETGEVIRSVLKPIGDVYKASAIDTSKDVIIEAEIDPASDEEIKNTVTVMGGEDWELWINALKDADVLAEGVKTVSYSYIGTEITWPIYWHGALGKAKEDMDRAASSLRESLSSLNGSANMAVLKSVVTQASAAIPVMPLYIAMGFKVMKSLDIHEGCIEQINRMFRTQLYKDGGAELDDTARIRMDDWELRDDVQNKVKEVWPDVTTENLYELTDYQGYKDEFLKLFGFGVTGIDYEADVDTLVDFEPITI
ncbi:MAG: bifunctional NADH-specific enoyl-ACP reductase/trans-2-enoyl-CoA reductase [endosymbiont of Galathealinum brachiosum]|uniref:Enoyl-[acyl-carrier-protein] reductase [NADH] n=1 Tax=endosymbiont of Galathealinum brachiosum TaxID=2200906 RepID=A0A370DJA6_9GAMM|nr:MAG: bifunctional NADH-specific enoyl-ACP reductase/trans-2-enoyl-CoA reductase [endosymbiont of Galathealinum brachiosum]